MSAFFSSDFFGGSNPGGIIDSGNGGLFGGLPTPVVLSSPTPTSTSGGGSSTTDWLNTIYKFAQLGTQTYIAQDALSSSKPVIFGANGQPIAVGTNVPTAASSLTSILGTSSIWLFLFIGILVLLFLKK